MQCPLCIGALCTSPVVVILSLVSQKTVTDSFDKNTTFTSHKKSFFSPLYKPSLPIIMSTLVSAPLAMQSYPADIDVQFDTNPTSPTSFPDADNAPPSPIDDEQHQQQQDSDTTLYTTVSADDAVDQLAEQSTTSPQAFLDLLTLLRPRLFSLASLPSDPTTLPTTASLSAEKRRALHHFSKLKLAYLHLQAKVRFLAACESEEEWEEVGEESRSKMEREIQQAKAEQSRVKQQLADSKAALTGRIETFATAWTEVEQQAEVMEQQWDETEWAELRSAMEELGVDDVMRMCDEQLYANKLDEQQTLIAQLQAEAAAVEADLQQRQQDSNKVAARLATMQADTAALLNQLTPPNMTPQPPTTYYQHATQLLNQLTGVSAHTPPHNQRSLLITVHGWADGSSSSGSQRSVEMEVDCVPGSGVSRFNGVRLVAGEVEWERWDEMVDYALEMQDLGFLVREVQQYLSSEE